MQLKFKALTTKDTLVNHFTVNRAGEEIQRDVGSEMCDLGCITEMKRFWILDA